VFFGIFNDFYSILLEFYYGCVNGSVGLKSLLHVETSIKNSKVMVRIWYENNFMPLHNKNVKINI